MTTLPQAIEREASFCVTSCDSVDFHRYVNVDVKWEVAAPYARERTFRITPSLYHPDWIVPPDWNFECTIVNSTAWWSDRIIRLGVSLRWKELD